VLNTLFQFTELFFQLGDLRLVRLLLQLDADALVALPTPTAPPPLETCAAPPEEVMVVVVEEEEKKEEEEEEEKKKEELEEFIWI
jgi:hypothetical protein